MRSENLSSVIRVVIGIWAPFTNPCANLEPPTLVPTSACSRPGQANQMEAFLLETARVPYVVLPQPEPLVWGAPTRSPDLPDEQFCQGWTGLLGQMLNGTIDIISALYTVTPLRSRCFDFSNPLVSEPTVIVHKDLEVVGDKLGALFRIYSGPVWTLALVTVLLATLMFAATSKVFTTDSEQSWAGHASTSFWICAQFVSDQISEIPKGRSMKSITGRWLLSMMGIFALFLLKLYENGLLVELLTTAKMKPFGSLGELASAVEAGRADYVLVDGHWLQDLLADEKVTGMEPMREALRSRPIRLVGSNEAGMEAVAAGAAGAVGFHTLQSLAAPHLGCGQRMSADPDTPVSHSSIILSPRRPRLRAALNEAINRAGEHNDFVLRRYASAAPICEEAVQRLGARNFLGVFMLGGLVAGAGGLALALELACARRRRRSHPAEAPVAAQRCTCHCPECLEYRRRTATL